MAAVNQGDMMGLSPVEVKRRIFHLMNGIILVGLIKFNLIGYIGALAILGAIIVLSMIVKRFKLPFVHWFFEQLDRPKDFEKIPGKGAIFYMIGVALVLFLFPKDIAMASVMILALGDSIAPLAGQYGSIPYPFNKKKYIEGGIVGAIVAAVGAMMFVSPLEASVAAVGAMVVEGIDWKLGINKLDDNIIMPLAAGGIIILLRMTL